MSASEGRGEEEEESEGKERGREEEEVAKAPGGRGGSCGARLTGGAGLTFEKKDGSGGLRVKRVKEEGAAAREGSIEKGDVIEAIDGKELEGMTEKELARVMVGEEGSVAVLEVRKRSGERRRVEVRRSPAQRVGGEESTTSLGSEASISSSTAGGDRRGGGGACGIGECE